MKRLILSGLVGSLALFAFLAWRVDAKENNPGSNPKSRPKWEYKQVVECYDQKELDKMGDEGWEMVAVTTTVNKWDFEFSTPGQYGGSKIKLSESAGASGKMQGYGGCSMYFKRQK